MNYASWLLHLRAQGWPTVAYGAHGFKSALCLIPPPKLFERVQNDARAAPPPGRPPWPLGPWPRPGHGPMAKARTWPHGQGQAYGPMAKARTWPLAPWPFGPPARASFWALSNFLRNGGGYQAKCRFKPMGPIGYCRPSLGPKVKQLRCIVQGLCVPGPVQGLGRELT